VSHYRVKIREYVPACQRHIHVLVLEVGQELTVQQKLIVIPTPVTCMVHVYHRTVLFLVSVIKDGREDNVNRKIRVLCLHVKIKDSVITTDQRSDVPVRMVGQERNVKQKLVVILVLVMVTENVLFPTITQFVFVM
jgi:hypothetical protein